MARVYPEIFPGPVDLENPEFAVYDRLRRLPDTYVVFYSKRFKGGLFGVEECEIDFIIFNQKNVMICLEVKGGTLAYDGTEDCWYQNGKLMARPPERQASAATHALIAHLKPKIQSVAVDWGLCFPQCCIQPGETATGLPAENIIDERKLGNIEQAVHVLEERIKKRFPRSGASPRAAQALIATLTRNIGFVQKLGVRIAREREQLIQITQEQLDVLNDLEANERVVVQGSAGTGKTIIAQEPSGK